MITGYNTDVRHREVVLHVQTEDKGLGNPFIESLVYVGGQVLVAKRLGYSEMLSEGDVGEKEIVALMDRQHRTMIAAIRHGKFDEKLRALQKKLAPLEATSVTDSTGGNGSAPNAVDRDATVLASDAEETSLLARAEEVDRTLDQVILEYLTNEAEQEQLLLLLENSRDVALGQRAQLALRASSSKSGEPIVGTEVTVKMISTADEPRILATAEAGEDGRVEMSFDIPSLSRGTAALIITGASDLGRAELKQLL